MGAGKKLPSSFSLALKNVLTYDERLGLQLFTFNKNNKVFNVFSEILSLSGDEILWFGVSAGVGCLLFTCRGLGKFRDMGCIEETAWDCFGTCTACISFEATLKLYFRRSRPTYIKQSSVYCFYGEWFSFPSGHTIRAFYALFWFSRSRFVKLLSPYIVFPRARYLIPWAIGVGISRIAKGKHFPLDVTVGAIIGSLAGYLIEDLLSPVTRAIIKSVSGIVVVANWGYYIVIPFFNGRHGKPPTWEGQVITGILFFLYALILLFVTMPDSMELAGGQTVQYDKDTGVAKCVYLF